MLQDTFVVGDNDDRLTDRDRLETVKDATQQVQVLLASLGDRQDAETIFTTAFGKSTGDRAVADLLTNWSAGNFEDFPKIEVLTEGELGDALGAYAAETQTIYLSGEFLAANRGNVAAVTDVLLEELGHWVDSQVNAEDSPGDEGAIFSALVRGEALRKDELAALKLESDLDELNLNGNILVVEKKTVDETLDFSVNVTQEEQNDVRREEASFTLVDLNEGSNFKAGSLDFDWSLNLNAELVPFFEFGKIETAGFTYPVNLDVFVPEFVANNESFSLIPSLDLQNPIDRSGAESQPVEIRLPKAGIDLKYTLGESGLKNVKAQNAPGGEAQEQTSDLLVPAQSGKIELVSFGQDSFQFSRDFGGLVSLNFKSPNSQSESNTEIGQTLGGIPTLKGTNITGNFAELSLDLDALLGVLYTPAKALSNKITFPNANQEKRQAQQNRESANLAIDAARDIETPEAFDVAQNEIARANESERIAKELEDRRKKSAKGFSVDLSYDLLDVKANLGLGLEQATNFQPGENPIRITMEIESQENQVGGIDDLFTFQAPQSGTGILKAKATYELVNGTITNSIGVIPTFQSTIDALKYSASINFGKFKLGPSGRLVPGFPINLPKNPLPLGEPFVSFTVRSPFSQNRPETGFFDKSMLMNSDAD